MLPKCSMSWFPMHSLEKVSSAPGGVTSRKKRIRKSGTLRSYSPVQLPGQKMMFLLFINHTFKLQLNTIFFTQTGQVGRTTTHKDELIESLYSGILPKRYINCPFDSRCYKFTIVTWLFYFVPSIPSSPSTCYHIAFRCHTLWYLPLHMLCATNVLLTMCYLPYLLRGMVVRDILIVYKQWRLSLRASAQYSQFNPSLLNVSTGISSKWYNVIAYQLRLGIALYYHWTSVWLHWATLVSLIDL